MGWFKRLFGMESTPRVRIEGPIGMPPNASREEPVHRVVNREPWRVATVKFNPSRVTDAIKADLKSNIKKVKEFDETNFGRVYDAALLSVSRGRDLGVLAAAILELDLPNMTKRRAGDIARSLNNKATLLMDRDRRLSLDIDHAIWMYSGAQCYSGSGRPTAKDIRQDTAHQAADGKLYEIKRGMLLNGRLTHPGREDGCKCASRSVIPGLET